MYIQILVDLANTDWMHCYSKQQLIQGSKSENKGCSEVCRYKTSREGSPTGINIIQPCIIINIESLQNIGDLPPNQLKNVQFIFLPLEQEGVFEVQYFIVWEFHLKLNVGVCKVYGGRYGEDGGGPSAFAKTSIWGAGTNFHMILVILFVIIVILIMTTFPVTSMSFHISPKLFSVCSRKRSTLVLCRLSSTCLERPRWTWTCFCIY